MIDDIELVADEIHDPPTGPQARAVARRFGPRHHETRQLPPLCGGQLGRPPRRRPSSQTGAAPTAVRPLPSAHRAPIHTQALGHDMHRKITLEQFDGMEAPSLELSWTPLWA